MNTIFEGAVVFPDRVAHSQLIVEDGKIAEIRTDRAEFTHADFKLAEGEIISPGFIDIQINGGFGKEFKTDDDAVDVVSRHLVEFGTTAFCPTVTTSDLATYYRQAEVAKQRDKGGKRTKFLGFHFEGPALNPKKVGAQNANLLKTPAQIEFSAYTNTDIRIVTLAPELDGAEEFISRLRAKGIRVGIGHSVISYSDLLKSFDPDSMIIVHLFNAMEPLTSRDPGLVGLALNNDTAPLSLIVDGVHLHPAVVNICWKAKANKRAVICITDGSAVTGLPLGTYAIGDRTISRMEDRAVLPNGTLVGSILTLNVAAKNLIHYTGCSISEAINTVSLNPATFLGLHNEIGQIKVGHQADLAILRSDFSVKQTLIDGVQVYAQASKQ